MPIKTTKPTLVRLANAVGAQLEFNQSNVSWVREFGEERWFRWRAMYQRLYHRLHKTKSYQQSKMAEEAK